MNGENKQLRTLIVDDSADDAMLMVGALHDGGFAVFHERVDTPFHLGEEIKNKSWDVILCDHNLPEFDAPHALRIVRQHDEELPFIIVSGSIADEVAVAAMKNGAADYVSKRNLSRLAPVVERELRESANRLDLKLLRRDLAQIKRYDPVSGLANRIRLIEHVDALRAASDSHGAVMLVELCRFKQLMKAVGSTTGRKLLLAIADRLAGFASGGMVARVGDDSMSFVASGVASEEAAGQYAKSVIESFWKPFQVEEHEFFICCRIGVSIYPQGGNDAGALLDNAETAMACAKDEGRGGYAVYVEGMDAFRQELLELERALYYAVRNDEFMLHYQPQFDLVKGVIVGVEALLRWNRPGHGVVPPAKFIPLLEETSLIVPVGEWVLRTACAASREWQRQGLPPIRMAVNLSAIQFRQPGLVAMVKGALAETGLAAAHLELEITENIAIYNEQETVQALRELESTGVKLAIDDFGTGYSSLNYLRRFPFGKLKIDQSFVRDISCDANGEGMVKAILGMAASLNLEVIAEGVETRGQVDFLQKCGCNEIQGYYFSCPVPEPEMKALLLSQAEGGRKPRSI